MNPLIPNRSGFSRGFFWFITIFLGLTLLYNLAVSTRVERENITLSELSQAVQEGKVERLAIKGNTIEGAFKDNRNFRTYKEADTSIAEYGITPDKVSIDVENPDKGSLLPTLLTVILPFLLLGGFIWFMFRSAQGANMRAMSFGKSTARLVNPASNRITFADVAGLAEPKFELSEVVEFLKSPEKFRALGAEIPKGVLLIGPPGTGKTLLAKAVAGEAGVPFFSISASEFVEMFVGVGAARVRDLFQKAKRNAPAILFIDELDAIGRMRGSGLGGSHDEREQTLNQILVEMDGFETDSRVIVMAATNRPDVLDSALLRPGRFDRRVVIDLPDKNERADILRIHTVKKPLASNVDLQKVAASSAGFSGADLKNMANEAAILTARAGRKQITTKDLTEAVEKVMMGPERRSRVLSEQEKVITATHELGHAIVGHMLEHCDPVHKISIISRGTALGYTWSLPSEDRRLITRDKFNDELAQMLGGRAAEKLILNQYSTGAQNDLGQATKIARDMVRLYGMSERIGPVALGGREEMVFLGRELGEHTHYSERVAAIVDEEVRALIEAAQARALVVLRKHRTALARLTTRLLKEEVLDGGALDEVLKHKKPKK